MNVLIDVQRACSDDNLPDTDTINIWVTRAIALAGTVDGDAEVAVRIVDADEMQRLNRDYRGKDKSTNVLSFPTGSIDGLPVDEPRPLGDIVVCAAVVSREAAEQGKALADHWAHMLVHGTLHLLGFDHQEVAQAAEMESMETRLLTDSGLPDPYGGLGQNC